MRTELQLMFVAIVTYSLQIYRTWDQDHHQRAVTICFTIQLSKKFNYFSAFHCFLDISFSCTMNTRAAILHSNSDVIAEEFSVTLQRPQDEVSNAKINDSVVQGDGLHFLSDESAVANQKLWQERIEPMHKEEPFSAAVFDSAMCCLTEPCWSYNWKETNGVWEKEWFPDVYRDWNVSFLLK